MPGNRYFKNVTGCKIAVHESGVEVLEKKLWPNLHLTKHGIPSRTVKVDRSLRDGDVISLGKYDFQILHTPGHTSDSICVSVNMGSKKVLFSGDTILAEGLIGEFGATVDFSEYLKSIEKITELKIDVLLPGHRVFVLS